ncbi:hypothetical protein [Streptomyces sp. NPDC018352]|uniref:hypothetical protein n=1 Tax=Streptomyces sp. NPDC018352 TaxID=3157194 RepID=UPI0033D0AC67
MTTYHARRTARSVALAAVTAALALGLTACGGADDGSKGGGRRPHRWYRAEPVRVRRIRQGRRRAGPQRW